MPNFIVRCISKKSGNPYVVHIDALSQQHAEDAAAAEGHVVQSGSATGPAQPPAISAAGSTELEIRALRAELREFKDHLLKSKALRSPVWTIGWGVIFSGVILLIIFALAFAALGALGLIHSVSQ